MPKALSFVLFAAPALAGCTCGSKPSAAPDAGASATANAADVAAPTTAIRPLDPKLLPRQPPLTDAWKIRDDLYAGFRGVSAGERRALVYTVDSTSAHMEPLMLAGDPTIVDYARSPSRLAILARRSDALFVIDWRGRRGMTSHPLPPKSVAPGDAQALRIAADDASIVVLAPGKAEGAARTSARVVRVMRLNGDAWSVRDVPLPKDTPAAIALPADEALLTKDALYLGWAHGDAKGLRWLPSGASSQWTSDEAHASRATYRLRAEIDGTAWAIVAGAAPGEARVVETLTDKGWRVMDAPRGDAGAAMPHDYESLAFDDGGRPYLLSPAAGVLRGQEDGSWKSWSPWWPAEALCARDLFLYGTTTVVASCSLGALMAGTDGTVRQPKLF